MATQSFINRDGTASIRELAQKICMLLSTFSPTMRKNYGTNPLFVQFLEWAEVACTIAPLLDELQAEFEPPSGDIPEGDETPGVNPNRPQPPEPPTPVT